MTKEEDTTLKIVVLDDEEQQRETFREKVKEGIGGDGVEVITWSPAPEDEEEFERREENLRRAGHWQVERETKLDTADVLIVDWDLLFLSGGNRVADRWAYWARGFSKCKIVVMVNRWGGKPNPFDLSLTWDPLNSFGWPPYSFADLEVGQDQLGSRRLWHGRSANDTTEEFQPWYWPVLTRLVAVWEKRVKDVEKALVEKWETKIEDFFGFSEEAWDWVAKPWEEATPSSSSRLVDLLRLERLWPRKHFEKVKEVLEKGNEDDRRKTIASIAPPIAGLLGIWLERRVLPGQDVLVDAPHLVGRLPSLMKGYEDIETWQRLTLRFGEGEPSFGEGDWAEANVYRFLADREHWLDRPLWDWRRMSQDEDFPEIRNPWGETVAPPRLFCEDTSSFCPEGEAKLFKADVESPFTLKHARRLKGVDYIPPMNWLD